LEFPSACLAIPTVRDARANNAAMAADAASQPDRACPAWRMGHGRSLTLDSPRIMAILNATPDSFYATSRAMENDAIDAARRAVLEGADILDIGGESTRPGATRVDEDEQIARVVPVIASVRRDPDPRVASIPISVDTTRARVALAAIDAGADAINDVSAGAEDGAMLALAAERGVGLVLMHRALPPERDQYSDAYAHAPMSGDIAAEVARFLLARARAAIDAGVRTDAIVLDPGLGFGKTVGQNMELVARTRELVGLGFPVLSALSRKSFIARAIDPDRPPPPEGRLWGTLGASVTHLLLGASIFRVHDVKAHREALDAAHRVRRGAEGGPSGEERVGSASGNAGA
jgi:dihydropteroate synthase